jgi:diguanylate cyclase (GGDEF)-like protein/PAS domain S-box-containing protein
MGRVVLSELAQRTASALASLLVLVGTGVCIAWIGHAPSATQILPSSAPVVFNTGLLFVVSGLGVLALTHDYRPITIGGAIVVTLLAGIILAEYLTGTGYGVDELFVKGAGSTYLEYPGRMAPNTASAFLVSGAGLLVLAAGRSMAFSASAAVLGSLALVIGLLALIGYAVGLETAYEWVRLSRMAFLTAAAFVLLGAALISGAIARSGARTWEQLPWVATTVGIGFSFMSLLAWQALRVELGAEPGAPPVLQMPNVILVLGLGLSTLLAAAIAQARHLKERAAEVAAANRLVEAHAEQIQDLYDRAPCGYHSLDKDGVFVEINRTELEWLGYARDEVIGKLKITDLFTPASVETFREKFPRFMKDGFVRDVELDLIRKDGSTLPVLVGATAIRDADGNYVKSRSIVYDNTDRKRAELEREQAAERLRLLGEEIQDLYDHAPCGYHSLDADGVFVRINNTELSWLGYSRTELIGKRSFHDLLTSDSRQRFKASYAEFVVHGQMKDADYELVCRDGTILPVSLAATAIRSGDGAFLQGRMTVYDVTERKRVERLLRESERELHRLLDNLQNAVVVHGADTAIRYANPAAARLLGLGLDQILGKAAIDPYWHFVREDGAAMPVEDYPVSRVLSEKTPLLDYMVGVKVSPVEAPRWMLTSAVPDLNEDGSIRQVIVSFVDISERKRLEQELEHLSRTDVLTGLSTRRHFMQLAEHEVKRLMRHGGPLSVLMLDVDHFKSINDVYGHHIGDAVLSTIGAITKRALRSVDIAGRLGGEEFAIVLPAADREHALEVAERLRQAIAAAEIPVKDGATISVTVSIGVAESTVADTDIAELLKRADQAMYDAKHAGRNQVRAAEPVAGAARRSRFGIG